MFKNKYLILLVAIFIIAIVVRILNDPNIPFHYDPGKNIVYVRAILDQFPLFPQFNSYFNLGEYYEYQVMFPYLIALLYKITGISLILLVKWSIIIIGSLMTISVYLLTTEIFNPRAGLISAALISIDKIQLAAYQNYYPQILALTILPLLLINLIKYTKTENKKYLIYTTILSCLTLLSSYITGIIYLSILITSLTIYSITRKKVNILFYLIEIIIGSIGLITFYVLPILDRYGFVYSIKSIADIIFIVKEQPFTNFPVSTIFSTAYQFIYVIIIIIVSIIIFIISIKKEIEIKFSEIKYEHILLTLFLLISLILVESFRFRPLLWTDRFLEFLDMSVIILAGYSIYFIIEKLKKIHKIIPILLLTIIFAYPIIDMTRDYTLFGYWNLPNDIQALDYVQNNISSNGLFVAPSGITSFWVSALGGVHVLGGESSQILGNKFDGNYYSDLIINSDNLSEKINLIRKFGVQYIYLTIRPNELLLWRNDYNLGGLKAFDKNYFDKIYQKTDSTSSVYILKFKENVTPKYNLPRINENITIIGYIISLLTLMTMILMTKKRKRFEKTTSG